MKESIAFYVIKYLDQIPELHLPGLGTFYQLHTPAEVDVSQKIIHPPRLSTSFNTLVPKNPEAFVSFMVYQSGKSKKTCSAGIRIFVNSILQQLKSNGAASVPFFGIFTLDNNMQVTFEPDPSSANARLMAFRPVPMLALVSQVEQDLESKPEKDLALAPLMPDEIPITPEIQHRNELITSEKLEENQTMSQDHTKVSEPIISQPEVIRQEPIVKETLAVAAMETPKYQATITPEAISNQKQSNAKKRGIRWTAGWFMGSIILLGMISLLIFLNRDSETIVGKAQFSSEESQFELNASPLGKKTDEQKATDQFGELNADVNSQLSDSQKEIKNFEVADPAYSLENKEERKNEEADVPTENTIASIKKIESTIHAECMIVVGAFGSSENVSRMEAKLAALGLQPYVLKRGTLTHVGVLKPCKTSELRSVLYRLRNEVEAGTWVLRIAGQPSVHN